MGDFPLMTEAGTFVINGAERVVVSQIVRSPGVYYGKEIDPKTDKHAAHLYCDSRTGALGWSMRPTLPAMFWVRIDKNRKLPITCLLPRYGAEDRRRNSGHVRRRSPHRHHH